MGLFFRHLRVFVEAGQQSHHLRRHHQTRARIPLPMTRLQAQSLPRGRARTRVRTRIQIRLARLLLITSSVVFLVLHRCLNSKGRSHLNQRT